MNIVKLCLLLTIGTLLMYPSQLYIAKKHGFPFWKTVLATILLTVCGLFGVKLMYFIENGDFGGLSFFGAVLFIPALYYGCAKALSLPYLKLLDTASAAICIMLAFMKIFCKITGCCEGKILYTTAAGISVRFPSQIVELVYALLVGFLLLWMAHRNKYKEKLYPIFMIVYGIGRFVLNFFRDISVDFFWLLSAGHFWSIISVVVGILWLLIVGVLNKKKECITEKFTD